MPIKYATKENLIIPKVKAVIKHEENPKNWILGSTSTSSFPILYPNMEAMDTVLLLPEREQQKFLGKIESYWCTNFGSNNVDRINIRKEYGVDKDMDERYIAVGSGTIRGQGNSTTAAEEFKRKSGVILERKNVNDMTEDEGWADITDSEYAEGKENLKYASFYYAELKRGIGLSYCTDEVLYDGLKRSVLKVCVDGSYIMDENGYIGEESLGRAISYTHCVTLIGPHIENGVRLWWDVLDSESNQLLKFVPDYKFGWPIAKRVVINNIDLFLKKKIMIIAIKGSNARFSVNPLSTKELLPYGTGLSLKVVSGSSEYPKVDKWYETIDELLVDYTLSDEMVTTAGWNKEDYIALMKSKVNS